MVLFPNCKINLGLNVIRKRTDGYHDLETVFYPVAVKDALEVIESHKFNFQLTGLPVSGTSESNLCVKAYDLLKEDFPDLPPVSIHLHKTIAMGAGLGGGSADGAFMLAALNKKFQLHLSDEELLRYASRLGSDCPFFIINKPCFATGRGEHLSQIQLDLSAYKKVLINPQVHVSTRDAFSKLSPSLPLKRIEQIIFQPVETWKNELKNDFEDSVFQLHPAIKEVKEALYAKGALYASMTGSGSTVYGIFRVETNIDLSFNKDYKCTIV
ncbi:MAG: 4-(cytidine 5'-diphospho)-2-C-methyl-D-erythritol kinase [Bacteroidota bacterium]|nr:4-(cytidine 5'-diphospho)-2-C-methyl-D-erythritol kinase [Bacteroidota bacterium]